MEAPSLPPPADAWKPLPAGEFDRAAAAHLLRRLGWTARPAAVDQALRDGPAKTIRAAYAAGEPMPMPAPLRDYIEKYTAKLQEARAAAAAGREDSRGERLRRFREQGPEAFVTPEMRQILREAADDGRKLIQDFGIAWLQWASDPARSAVEKLTLCLQNILVIGAPKVRQPNLLFEHQQLLRRAAIAGQGYGELCAAVTRNPGMVVYLDLAQARKGQPNENFARELFELFMLGEGAYTEADIKEAARAFTGYTQVFGRFVHNTRQADLGTKTVFGQKGDWTGDDIVRLALQQSAAATHFPRRFLRFYLGEELELPAEHLEALGAGWRRSGFSLGWLRETVFASRLFYAAAVRAAAVKSPFQFYLGFLQDFGLDPVPVRLVSLGLLRQAGQAFYSPPNVRGWVGGRQWVNSATLTARRALVASGFTPVRSGPLNADDQQRVEAATAAGYGDFTVAPDWFAEQVAGAGNDAAGFVRRWTAALLSAPLPDTVEANLTAFLKGGEGPLAERVREFLTTLCESPQYQLC